ncbi:type III-B CRISPR module RAMP protein Cmr1 [Paenibacillus amylolyticus]|uniref:Type III-B CRISPR module RAMP protein Cmr1 n=1 Tax=Paenibacillus amylolyticus TaxID=1451 RepID=A0ABD8B2U0_PAEAM
MGRNLESPRTRLITDDLAEISYTVNRANTYTIALVTPMFGGGHETGQVDANRLIRESTIRGQLRFWWRATRGARFKNTYELRQREAEIFGDTVTPSSVRVTVNQRIETKIESYTVGSKNKPFPDYIFQETDQDRKTGKKINYASGCQFDLEVQWSQQAIELKTNDPIRFQELVKDINAALWGWINFGGIGSRTRRGCGSLYCMEFSPNEKECTKSNFPKWLDSRIKDYELVLPTASEHREWPTLNPRMLIDFIQQGNNSTWRNVIRVYKDFRRRAKQNEVFDERKQQMVKRPGRSYWPEADSIRKTLDMAHIKHDKPTHYYLSGTKEEVTAFPRAELGMPIIFQFKSIRESTEKYKGRIQTKKIPVEPYKTQLTPKDKDRLASPIILKPLAFNCTRSVGLIAVLNHPPVEQLDLTVLEKEKDKGYSVNKSSKPLHYKNSPMIDDYDDQKVYSSAVDAFVHSREVKRFWKITSSIRH